MTLLNEIPLSALQLYLTAPYTCSYLPEQMARSQVATPSFLITPQLYSDLVQRGFRRSGTFTYRPRCDTCRACVPVRVDISGFAPNRSQRRALKRHDNNLHATLHTLADHEEYFQLYQRYQAARHSDSEMESDSREQYRSFLLQSHVDSMLVEFREHGELRMVSIIDLLQDGISSVYTFYEPDARASYGTYGVLWQIELCRRLKLPYLYLGYWIRDSRKMAYKSKFAPLQGLVQGVWQYLPEETA